MYNKTKRAFDLVAAIISIVGGSIITLICLIGLATVNTLSSAVGGITDSTDLISLYGFGTLVVVIALLIVIALGLTVVILGAMLCKKPVKVNGVYPKRKGLNITLIVFLGILTLNYINSPLLFLTFAAALGFKITAMCLKAEVEASATPVAEEPFEFTPAQVATEIAPAQTAAPAPAPAQAPAMTIDEKIKELKKLKELGVLDDEQYNAAIEKIIRNA